MADDLDVLPSTDASRKTIAAYGDSDNKLKQLMRLVFGVSGDPQVVSKTNGLPTVMGGRDNEPVAAGQTDQIMGGTGAVGDMLDFIWVVPTTTSPGAISVKDGNGTAVEVFHGGTIPSVLPFPIPWGKAAVNATTPGWKITTGANVAAIGWGKFT